MPEGQRMNWRELCNAALEAKDPDELLKILQELNKALKHEEQVRRDFREATRTGRSSVNSDVSNYRESNDTSAYFQHK
jgi:ribosomal protein L16 Arg81 hydroxylase